MKLSYDHFKRVSRLERIHNFRQLGGYATRDGRRVRWGRLYRSGHLADASNADLKHLRSLNLRVVCDLRGQRERDYYPNRLPPGGRMQQVVLAIEQRALATPTTYDRLYQPDVSAADVQAAVVQAYQRLVSQCTSQYAQLMQLLCDNDNLPLLLHCAGGKDRTGFAAAVILGALGVDRATIFEDFLLTNELVADTLSDEIAAFVASVPLHLEPEVVRPLFVVEECYLTAALSEVDRLYGSLEAYLREGLGLDEPKLQALRRNLLIEPTGRWFLPFRR